MRIDAHQHYWKISRNDYGWISTDDATLYRDYLPSHLRPHLHRHHITQTVVVQAASTIAETEFLLGMAAQEESIAGVVGWLDLEDPTYHQHYEQLAKHPKFVGFRVMIQDMEDPTVILKPNVIEALRYFEEKRVPVDLLVTSPQLPVVLQLLAQVPKLHGVINHVAKPDIANHLLDPWRTHLEGVSGFPDIYCKVSGMVTEADHQHWQLSDFAPYVHHVLDLFGPDRVMFGSDWPVCLLAASYDEVIEVAQACMPSWLSQQDIDQVFGRTAANFYGLRLAESEESK